MSGRIVLVVLWLLFFVAAVGVTIAYGHQHDAAGIVLLSDQDVVICLQRLATLYGAYLGVILLAWFTRPVPPVLPLREGQAMSIAGLCTVIFNLLILYFVARGHVLPGVDVVRDTQIAQQVALWFGFIVAPAMIYYFGVRPG